MTCPAFASTDVSVIALSRKSMRLEKARGQKDHGRRGGDVSVAIRSSGGGQESHGPFANVRVGTAIVSVILGLTHVATAGAGNPHSQLSVGSKQICGCFFRDPARPGGIT